MSNTATANIKTTRFQSVDYFSIKSFVTFRGLPTDITAMKSLEEKAIEISKANGLDVFRVVTDGFDDVNTYHIDVLTQLFG